MKKVILEGDKLPRGYGFSYRSYSSLQIVCYPFPLNHLISAARELWFFVRNASINTWEMEKINNVERRLGELKIAERELEERRKDFDEYRLLLFQAIRESLLNKPQE